MFYINQKVNNNLALVKYVEFNGSYFDLTNSYLVQALQKLPVSGNTSVTQPKRLDVLSFNIYKTTELWWLLALYNGVVDPESILEGQTIYYPSYQGILSLFLKANTGSGSI